jgi:hypothetical protein
MAEVSECHSSLLYRAEVVAIADQDQGRYGDLGEIGVAVAGPVRPALEGAPDVGSPVALAARGVLVGPHQREDFGHLRVSPERLLDDFGINMGAARQAGQAASQGLVRLG